MWITGKPWLIWRSIIADGAVRSESDIEGLIESRWPRIKDSLASPESTITEPEASQQTLFVLNVTDCSMNELD